MKSLDVCPVMDAFSELSILSTRIPVRHWLSLKTQPIRSLLSQWRNLGLGVQVVGEYEVRAAQDGGFSTDFITVNGVGEARQSRCQGSPETATGEPELGNMLRENVIPMIHSLVASLVSSRVRR